QLDVDVLKFYIPKDIPRYLVQPCPEDSVFRPLMVRLCAGTDNGHGETGPENPFLTFALVSAFCEQDIFFPFLKTCLKQSMADQVATVINRNVSENWTIHRVASELYVSVSLLKKKTERGEYILHTYSVGMQDEKSIGVNCYAGGGGQESGISVRVQ
ncbi:putative regulatory protein, partial [Salmonella enterica subsp. enterica serovar Enteritidis str. CDC_2010K_1882]